MVLVDAGAEVDSLYTADVTRTILVDGRFTAPQRRVYEAVLEAADAAFERAGHSGTRFRDLHAAAMEVLARHLYASRPPTMPQTRVTTLSPSLTSGWTSRFAGLSATSADSPRQRIGTVPQRRSKVRSSGLSQET